MVVVVVLRVLVENEDVNESNDDDTLLPVPNYHQLDDDELDYSLLLGGC